MRSASYWSSRSLSNSHQHPQLHLFVAKLGKNPLLSIWPQLFSETSSRCKSKSHRFPQWIHCATRERQVLPVLRHQGSLDFTWPSRFQPKLSAFELATSWKHSQRGRQILSLQSLLRIERQTKQLDQRLTLIGLKQHLPRLGLMQQH